MLSVPIVWLLRHVIRIQPRVASVLALLLGITFTVLGARRQSAINEGDAKRTFDDRAERAANAVTARMAKYEYGLRGTRGAVVASGGEHFDQRRMEEYNATRDFGREFPGALGVGVVRRVGEVDEAAFVALAQRTRPAFRVRQVEPHAGDRFVIEYLDPEERNRAAIGLDIASEADRRSAAVDAMRTGWATLTRPLTRVEATGEQECPSCFCCRCIARTRASRRSQIGNARPSVGHLHRSSWMKHWPGSISRARVSRWCSAT